MDNGKEKAKSIKGAGYMTIREQYESKFISVEEALGKIRSNDTLVAGHYGNEPRNLMRQLHTIGGRVSGVSVWTNNPSEDYPFIQDERFQIYSAFYGGPLRKIHATGRVSFAPNNLHSLSQVIVETKKPTIFMAAVTPLDEYGYVGMSMSQQMEREMLEAADMVILEVNENIPRTIGTVQIPVDKVDYFVKAEGAISCAPEYPVTATQQAIAHNVAELIHDGDCLQFGIGGLPNAVADALMGKKDLGVHTEMFSDAMGKLMEAGVINNYRKNLHPGQSICAFAWGSDHFYQYIDKNPLVRVLPVSYVNDPFIIAQNDNMVSVNTALQIDLTGQVCSESLGFQQFSGTGGASDFAYGAYHSKGGRGILAISATAKGGTISRIQPGLTYGSAVSISRNIVDYVVTEYGIAKLRGKTIRQRRDELIAIAAPEFREELKREADRLMIW